MNCLKCVVAVMLLCSIISFGACLDSSIVNIKKDCASKVKSYVKSYTESSKNMHSAIIGLVDVNDDESFDIVTNILATDEDQWYSCYLALYKMNISKADDVLKRCYEIETNGVKNLVLKFFLIDCVNEFYDREIKPILYNDNDLEIVYRTVKTVQEEKPTVFEKYKMWNYYISKIEFSISEESLDIKGNIPFNHMRQLAKSGKPEIKKYIDLMTDNLHLYDYGIGVIVAIEYFQVTNDSKYLEKFTNDVNKILNNIKYYKKEQVQINYEASVYNYILLNCLLAKNDFVNRKLYVSNYTRYYDVMDNRTNDFVFPALSDNTIYKNALNSIKGISALKAINKFEMVSMKYDLYNIIMNGIPEFWKVKKDKLFVIHTDLLSGFLKLSRLEDKNFYSDIRKIYSLKIDKYGDQNELLELGKCLVILKQLNLYEKSK